MGKPASVTPKDCSECDHELVAATVSLPVALLVLFFDYYHSFIQTAMPDAQSQEIDLSQLARPKLWSQLLFVNCTSESHTHSVFTFRPQKPSFL